MSKTYIPPSVLFVDMFEVLGYEKNGLMWNAEPWRSWYIQLAKEGRTELEMEEDEEYDDDESLYI